MEDGPFEDVIPIEKSGDMILVYFMAYKKLWPQQHSWVVDFSPYLPWIRGIYVWDMWSQKGHALNNQVFFIAHVRFTKVCLI